MWKEIMDLFSAYMGTGLIIILYLAAVLFLWLVEKKKPVRICLVYFPIICLLLFFCPLFKKIIFLVLDNEVYYRILWLLPVSVTISYASVLLYLRLEQAKHKVLYVLILFLSIAVCGDYVYDNINFKKAENIYHVPQNVVDICDSIKYEGREVMAVFPSELIQYVRQYSPYVCMPYGREILVDRWFTYNGRDLFDCMESDTIKAEDLTSLARNYSCVYIIIAADKNIEGKMSAYDYLVYDIVDAYVIYKDATVELAY